MTRSGKSKHDETEEEKKVAGRECRGRKRTKTVGLEVSENPLTLTKNRSAPVTASIDSKTKKREVREDDEVPKKSLLM